MRHCYIHIPYCASKCPYCGFASVAESPPPDFMAGILRDFDEAMAHDPAPLHTIYVGGGTPTHLPPEQLALLRHLAATSSPVLTSEFLALSSEIRKEDELIPLPSRRDGSLGRYDHRTRISEARSECEIEFTVETNPATLTDEKARILRQSGVNRVSVGAQSFDPATLAFLGRRHTADDIAAAVRRLRNAGFANIALDLIAAVPTRSEVPASLKFPSCGGMPASLKFPSCGGVPEGRGGFLHSLDRALALAPQHISVYTLSIEEGTPFARDNIALLPDDEQLDQLAAAEERLAREGYLRYEISNYALPGHECRHNLAVWRGEDYTGIGPAAASRNGLTRMVNPFAEVEGRRSKVEPEEDAAERFITGLRLSEGVAIPSTPQGAAWQDALDRLIPLGLVKKTCSMFDARRSMLDVPVTQSEHRTSNFELPTSNSLPCPPRYTLTARGREVADAITRTLL